MDSFDDRVVYKPTIYSKSTIYSQPTYYSQPSSNLKLDLFPSYYPTTRYQNHKQQNSFQFIKRFQMLRLLLSVTAFIKLLESLFWLSLLLEATKNEDDNSGLSLTIILSISFFIAFTTGFTSLFGPCFNGVVHLQFIILLTVISFICSIGLLVLTFTLSKFNIFI